MSDKAYIENAMKEGAERASAIARRTVAKVNRKVGII